MRTELHGKQILLRALRDSDASCIAIEANDPVISRFTPVPHPYTPDHASSFVSYAMKARDEGRGYVFGIVRRPEDRILGVVELGNIKKSQRLGEIGYWLGKDHRRQGYMTDTVLAMLEFGFADLGLHRIQAYVDPENTPSRSLLEKIGFSCEGVLRDFVFHGGKFFDRCIYAIFEK